MRKELAIGICFCIAGMLTVCFFGYTYFTTYGFLNAYHMQAFAGAKLEVPALLGNIIWERGKLFLLICLVAFEEGCTTCSAVWNLFYSRGVPCGKHVEYGISRRCIFCGVAFPALPVLFDGAASYFWSGYP